MFCLKESSYQKRPLSLSRLVTDFDPIAPIYMLP